MGRERKCQQQVTGYMFSMVLSTLIGSSSLYNWQVWLVSFNWLVSLAVGQDIDPVYSKLPCRSKLPCCSKLPHFVYPSFTSCMCFGASPYYSILALTICTPSVLFPCIQMKCWHLALNPRVTVAVTLRCMGHGRSHAVYLARDWKVCVYS
jgi:hypothetical protein